MSFYYQKCLEEHQNRLRKETEQYVDTNICVPLIFDNLPSLLSDTVRIHEAYKRRWRLEQRIK